MSQHEYMWIERPPAQIYTLIPKVMQEIGGISKGRENKAQGYKFRGIEDFYLAAHPALLMHGVFCAPKVKTRQEYRFEKTNDQGRTTTWLHVALEVEHVFYAPDGSNVSVVTWGEGLDNSDKATNKAMSGAMKYALIELFCVPTQDVEDSDRTSPEAGSKQRDVPRTTEAIPLERPNRQQPNNGQGGKPQDGAVRPSAADKPYVSDSAMLEATAPGADVPPPVNKKELRDLQKEAKQSLTVKPAELPEGHILAGKCANIHKEFRMALREDLQSKADALLKDWLKHQGIVDSDGEPTASAILDKNFADCRAEAIAHARTL